MHQCDRTVRLFILLLSTCLHCFSWPASGVTDWRAMMPQSMQGLSETFVRLGRWVDSYWYNVEERISSAS